MAFLPEQFSFRNFLPKMKNEAPASVGKVALRNFFSGINRIRQLLIMGV